MRTLISIIILLLFGHSIFGQYRIESKIQGEFENLFDLQPKWLQKKRYIPGIEGGFALLLTSKVDTINFKDYRPLIRDTSRGSITIVEIDPITNEKMPNSPIDTTKYNP